MEDELCVGYATEDGVTFVTVQLAEDGDLMGFTPTEAEGLAAIIIESARQAREHQKAVAN